MFYKLCVAACVAFLSSSVLANDYRVNVTRADSNLYKVDGGDFVINTRYCYEYVFYEDSLLRMAGFSSEIIFLNSGSRCDVKGVYQSVSQSAGNYSVLVSREDDDWYEIWGQGLFIRTNMCLSLALGEDAILSLRPGGYGTLYVSGDECQVEGVYSKVRM